MFVTKGAKYGQGVFLILTALVNIIFLCFLIIEFTSSMLALYCIQFAFFLWYNGYLRNYYDIKIDKNDIVIENLWRHRVFPRELLDNIKPYHFPFPYPLNPFIQLIFKNGERIITKVSSAAKVHLLKGGMDKYVIDLKKQILS